MSTQQLSLLSNNIRHAVNRIYTHTYKFLGHMIIKSMHFNTQKSLQIDYKNYKTIFVLNFKESENRRLFSN